MRSVASKLAEVVCIVLCGVQPSFRRGLVARKADVVWSLSECAVLPRDLTPTVPRYGAKMGEQLREREYHSAFSATDLPFVPPNGVFQRDVRLQRRGLDISVTDRTLHAPS